MNPLRRALLDMDLAALRAIWASDAGHLPQALSDAETAATAHYARTVAASIPMRARAWSHRWLLDHGLPSGLPDELKPKAEQICPVVVEGVGIAVMAGSDLTRPIVGHVRDAMSVAVEECYADGDRDPAVVRQRMMDARRNTTRHLLGIGLST